MAVSLSLKFNAAGDRKVSMTFPYADSTAGDAQVKSLMQSIVANGEIYAEPPLTLAGAEFVSRTVIPVDLED
ncbi:MAG: DUF2922 domain-containing protein [Synergistaceae bacterium]|jgi:hypothetical protein|nr:DUF2922 domain-containing protein [Synergistaceae bacterium]